MGDRVRGRWTFSSWRGRKKKKSPVIAKSSTDDINVSYGSDNVNGEGGGAATVTNERRKSKKSTLARLFKPWKWKRKKKGAASSKKKKSKDSDIVDKSNQSADKPVVDGDVHVQATGKLNGSGDADPRVDFPAGTGNGQDCTLQTSDGSNGQKPDTSTLLTHVEINSSETVPKGPADGRGDFSPPLPEKAEGSPALPPKQTDSPGLPPKKGGVRIGGSNDVQYQGSVGFNPGTPTNRSRGLPHFSNVVQTIPSNHSDIQCNGDVGHQSDEDSLSDYENNKENEDTDEDDEDHNTSLAAKVKRNDSLAFHLRNRPTRKVLEERNILPQKSATQRKDEISAVGAKLVRRLSQRPTVEELEQKNIYRDQKTDTDIRSETEEKKRTLIRKLSFRPTVEELRRRNIIKFNEYVEVVDAHEYDRRADKPWTKLTPQDKASIRKELNDFKSSEMEVHEESRIYTRFHRP